MKDQPVLILGLGASGLSMARWCAREGARVTVADTREAPPQLVALQGECPDAVFISGAFDEALLSREPWALIARSPGLTPAELQGVFDFARERGVPVLTELDLFAQALQALSQRERFPYRPQVLAVTGTNGKTTVTSLAGQLLDRAGWSVAVAGNIGPALLDVLAAALHAEAVAQAADDEREAAEAAETEAKAAAEAQAEPAKSAMAAPLAEPEPETGPLFDDGSGEFAPADASVEADEGEPSVEATDEPATALPDGEGPTLIAPPPPEPPQPPHLPRVWVLELSSFQLDGTAQGAWAGVPTASTLLNLSEDHLDWHGDMDAYTQAKAAVFGARALMVLNRDDPRVMAMKPGLVTVKIGNRNRQVPARAWCSLGLDAPTRAGDWGLETVNGMTWLVRALAVDETRTKGRAQEDEEIYFQRLMPAEALRIRGRHNAANALAALALATSTGAPLAPMLHGLREYRGEPHRVEPVAIVDGVEYFDDSKGTNVGATLAAVNGLGAERRLVVILGGDGKGQDFTPLAAPLARHARAVVFIGRDAPLLRAAVQDALRGAGVPLHDAGELTAAVRLAAELAQSGDAVLMSPACASLDQFRNYVQRAEVFVAAVRELAEARGMGLEGGL
ncbi:MAG TPA: UDP-N-acetylmuramoyl-L-alanine--D-glutamate ligase [Hydrogenophaga sp.]|uniref:UDP-N-acetylmuramoyl-L-alanine--D-glutamate ligase n=1 Tax=Hydrogenophaga sp. TaxID=1904254 RepID=UPI002CEDECD5|nr:UDP-N-acetylmuramoyl-L-alanine--D-glutamate ligase [Hydrogenophaga sp.]HSX95222.1 UDP-N-acetylmuramoyl-L-alanine--D-glutamate ligase [Hydrogenophaga sp.]